MNRRSSLLLRIPLLIVSALSLLSGPANAENPRVTETTDFWFQYEEPTTFFSRTYAVEGVHSDPMLWLYNSEGELIAQNDDYHGLQSQLEVEVTAGTYRLRAGVCCGDPNRWWQGVQYDITFNGIATVIPSSTTTIPVETTTSSSSTSTTTTSSTTTTTTIQETTTTWVTTTTTVLTPNVTVTTTTVPPTTTTIPPDTTTTSIIATLPTNQSTNDASNQQNVDLSVPNNPATTTTIATVPATTTPLVVPTTVPSITVTPNEPLNASEEAIQALQTATELTVDVLEEVLANIEVSELTEEQESELVAVLNVANEEVKKAFEEEVNVYAEGLDSYVPVGSTVTVGTRRVIIATTGLLLSAPVVAPAGQRSEVRRKQ